MSELSIAQVQQTHMLCSELPHLTAERVDLSGRGSFQEISLLMVMEEGRCTSMSWGFRNSATGPHLYLQILGTKPCEKKNSAKLYPHWS